MWLRTKSERKPESLLTAKTSRPAKGGLKSISEETESLEKPWTDFFNQRKLQMRIKHWWILSSSMCDWFDEKFIFEYEKRMKWVSAARRGVPRGFTVFVFGEVFTFNFGDFLPFLFCKLNFFVKIDHFFLFLIHFGD